jgi:Flp pilus assembly protein TadD
MTCFSSPSLATSPLDGSDQHLPASAHDWLVMAHLSLRAGDLVHALECAEWASALNPNLMEAWALQSHLLRQFGLDSSARRAAFQAERLR